MKRSILVLCCLSLVLMLPALGWCQGYGGFYGSDETDEGPAAVVPGAAHLELTIPRVEENGRLLVQMREIFEALGWTVDWDPASRTIDADQEGYHMVLQINNRLALVNGKQYDLDVPPRLIYHKTFVPMRFVAESTDCQVDYLGNAVQITGQDGTVLMVYLSD